MQFIGIIQFFFEKKIYFHKTNLQKKIIHTILNTLYTKRKKKGQKRG